MSERRPTELKTPEFIASYPSLFKPKLNDLAEPPKYEYLVDGLFDKDTTDMQPFEAAIEAAIEAQWGDRKNLPKLKTFRWPIKDGDEMENPQYAGKWVIGFKASENYKPLVVGTKKDQNGRFIPLTEKEFYGGCIARAVVNAFAYDKKSKTGATVSAGISFGLGNVQKLRDGDKFGGGGFAPEQDFDDTPEDSGEDLSADF